MRETLASLSMMAIFLSVVVLSAISVDPSALSASTKISCFDEHVEYEVDRPIERIDNYRTWTDETHTTIIYDEAGCSFEE